MAIRHDITVKDGFFAGTDKALEFEVLQADGNTPEDIGGYALEWTLRKRTSDAAAAVQKTTGAGGGIVIEGTYNADRALNTQRAVVTVAAANTTALKPATYQHALKRTDAGSADVLSFGSVALQQAAAH